MWLLWLWSPRGHIARHVTMRRGTWQWSMERSRDDRAWSDLMTVECGTILWLWDVEWSHDYGARNDHVIVGRGTITWLLAVNRSRDYGTWNSDVIMIRGTITWLWGVAWSLYHGINSSVPGCNAFWFSRKFPKHDAWRSVWSHTIQ